MKLDRLIRRTTFDEEITDKNAEQRVLDCLPTPLVEMKEDRELLGNRRSVDFI